jgi:hypothetical protein
MAKQESTSEQKPGGLERAGDVINTGNAILGAAGTIVSLLLIIMGGKKK